MQTDFPPEPLDAGVPWCSVLGVGGALFTTFALGFTEGCLEIERRPIPLRFALRFAAANVLPSVVFRSVPARHVAAASGVPLSALISDTDVASSRSAVVGKRLVLVKSVRALRLAAGSYGLAWSLWRWHESDTASSNNNGNKEGVKYGESVVRLAPVNSPLSRASRRKHRDHIMTVPLNTESSKKPGANSVLDTVNWEKVGVEVQLEEEGEQGERVKVIEVELNDVETTVEYAGELKTKASKKDGTSVYSVAVLPLCGPPIPPSAADSFDVCFSPLSAVLTFIASVCHERGITHVILAVDEEEGGECVEDIVRGASSPWLHLSTSQVATGLLYRHGITSSVLTTRDKKIVDENAEREGGAGHSIDSNSEVVFFISESVSAGHLAARKMSEQGLIVQQNACFIVEESLCGQSVPKEAVQAASELLRTKEQNATEQNATEQQETAEVDEVTYLSVTDVTDQTLQGIRNLVRQGNKPDAIQAAVYRAFGTQRVVAPTRLDQSSDMHI
ncbi:hypothetical protein PC129_g14844 [Phytophthora cactorum]|uniref:Uncharacterized protein n=1 Tax=Phytophthora cactorum TaxID=29920 RepID=A0A329RPB7_9STRA|nr:hypothetical protein Pcac1_g22234 [Phytophthora cactorum]KAG2909730.1 hypothetical protein PC115_g13168 [Phytophthora cactorum]KAG2917254.1 hypothetical protein PC117_g17516 [Phytophthora cactorum]KAG2995266.1 hypothetical protein PC118_g3085 [Phytophthora cactorum]KAG2998692.1 hypothetical protein PC119_g17394 [Phytophthora cactorum]